VRAFQFGPALAAGPASRGAAPRVLARTAVGSPLGSYSAPMNRATVRSFTLRLSSHRAGRVLLHAGVLLRSPRNWRWHLRNMLRDLVPFAPRNRKNPIHRSPSKRVEN